MTQVNLNSLSSSPAFLARAKTQPQVTTLKEPLSAPLKADKSQQLVDTSIRHQLEQVLEQYGVKLDKVDPQEFTPEKVSDRILGFVQMGLQRAKASGADDDKLQNLFNAARSGIEKGFKEAKELLTGLQQFQGKVEQDANQTLKLLNEGMDTLATQWFADPAPAKTAPNTAVKAAEFASFEQQNRLSLEIQTRDGDRIRLSFNQSSAAYQNSSEGQQLNLQRGREASAAFSLEIDGDLSESEQQALAGLIEQVQGVSERFFGDDLTGAFKAATELGFDSEQLAGFSLDLQRTQTKRYAQTYQTTQQPSQSPIKAFLAAGEQFRQSFQQPGLADLLASPRQTATELLDLLVTQDSRFEQLTQSLQEQAQAALNELTHGFTDALLALQPAQS